ncbi:SDR family oxidoreductase [Nostoc sp. DedSLP04]|uniref:SDR family oxidoreductase n=1 Tax=Nostoc sp. DedSLP04 TaxID=3075401 RepID=UPI002AD367DE|nr:SDR family oxidoreductase [Nostoc sp. DedSLP04]MDZ8033603.1 SDR family oxidoreductase [Nostoc sp. DedSLP04]
MLQRQVIVIGATGLLGGKVVKELLQKGHRVRALVRPGTEASHLQAQGVEIVRGDITEYETLLPAMHNIDVVITTANGYSHRKKGDSLENTDDKGNRNLVDAAKQMQIKLFVFTSILTAEKAKSVPHFYQKSVTEDYIEKSGVPFVSLRPGGFVDTLLGFSLKDIKNGKFRAMADADAPASTIHSDDVARYLVLAIETPEAVGHRIDLGTEQPTNLREIANLLSEITGQKVQLQTIPPLVKTILFKFMAVINPMFRGTDKAMEYVSSGKYVADTTLQRRLFAEVPSLRDSIRRWANQNGLAVTR